MMIQVVIEMDPTTGTLNIKSGAPPPIVFAIVLNAYHEVLSFKVREDIKAESRIIQVEPGTQPPRPPTGSDGWKRPL